MYLEKKILKAHLSMVLFSLFVSGSFVLGAEVSHSISPVSITFARFCIAMVFIMLIYILTNVPSLRDFRSPTRFLSLGFLISIYFVLMFEGLKIATPVSMSVVFTLTPLMAGLLEYLISGRKMSRRIFFGAASGALGAVWIIFNGDLQRLVNLEIGRGELIFLIGCAGHALYAVLIPKFNKGESSIAQTLGTLVACSILLLALGQKSVETTVWVDLSFLVWVTIFYLAIFATAASFFLIQFAANRLSAVKVMAYTYTIPFWVTYLNWIVGGGFPDTKILWGAAVIFIVLVFFLFNREN